MGVTQSVYRAWMALGLLPGLLSVELLQAAGSSGPIQLRDVTQATGVGFIHTDGSSGRHYIVETVASGLALFDYDGDGLVDIYFLNGAALPGAEFSHPPEKRVVSESWRLEVHGCDGGIGRW
jgi:hypothetical protein